MNKNTYTGLYLVMLLILVFMAGYLIGNTIGWIQGALDVEAAYQIRDINEVINITYKND